MARFRRGGRRRRFSRGRRRKGGRRTKVFVSRGGIRV